MLHPELPVASFICAFLVLVPLPWQWRAGTVPTISISLWLFVSNIINGVNTIIWAGNVQIRAVVWCDITIKIISGANVALPISVFCLCVHLERVSSTRETRTTLALKRRRQMVDGLMCFGLPLIYMAFNYIVQGHRFDIVEDFGCRTTVYASIPAIFLVYLPPLLFSLGACVLSGLTFRNFWIRRISFAGHLQNSNSALTPSIYFRLMSMALVQMLWGLTVTSVNICFSLKSGLRPWISWANVHAMFSNIGLFPTILIPRNVLLYTFLLWWMVPVTSILFFGFFSFGNDAVKEYKLCIEWFKRTILCVKGEDTSQKIGFLSISYPRKGEASVTHSDVEIDLSLSILNVDVTSSPTSISFIKSANNFDYKLLSSPITDISSHPLRPNRALLANERRFKSRSI